SKEIRLMAATTNAGRARARKSGAPAAGPADPYSPGNTNARARHRRALTRHSAACGASFARGLEVFARLAAARSGGHFSQAVAVDRSSGNRQTNARGDGRHNINRLDGPLDCRATYSRAPEQDRHAAIIIPGRPVSRHRAVAGVRA